MINEVFFSASESRQITKKINDIHEVILSHFTTLIQIKYNKYNYI